MGLPSRFWRFSFHSVLQISGQIFPLLAAAIAVPVIYRHIDPTAFGAFTIALSALGMFAMLDLGLGRATVRFMARALAAGDTPRAASVAVYSALLLGVFALVLCLLAVSFLPAAASRWMQAGAGEDHVLTGTIYLLAAALPFVALTAVVRSALEACEKFPTIALVHGATGTLTYLVPMLLSFATNDMRDLVAGAVLCRVLALFAFAAALRIHWSGPFPLRIAWRAEEGFLKFALWLTVSNLAGTAIVYADRALLVRLFPLAQVAFYNVPLELLSRLLIVVNGAATVAFPALSRAAADRTRFDEMYVPAIIGLGACAAAFFLALSLLAPPALQLWLGEAFRVSSSDLVRFLLIGLMFQSLNVVSLTVLNALGIARRVAVMHLIEMPVYLAALGYFGSRLGLTGVAVVWSARMLLEYVVFAVFQAQASSGAGVRSRWKAAALGLLQGVPLGVMAVWDNPMVAVPVCIVITLVSLRWVLASFSPRQYARKA